MPAPTRQRELSDEGANQRPCCWVRMERLSGNAGAFIHPQCRRTLSCWDSKSEVDQPDVKGSTGMGRVSRSFLDGEMPIALARTAKLFTAKGPSGC